MEEVKKPSEGLSLFFVDFDKSQPGLELKRIKKMGGGAVDANEVFFDGYRIPADSLIGKEGQGFKIVLHGMNAERCLLAGEALGLGYAALKRCVRLWQSVKSCSWRYRHANYDRLRQSFKLRSRTRSLWQTDRAKPRYPAPSG